MIFNCGLSTSLELITEFCTARTKLTNLIETQGVSNRMEIQRMQTALPYDYTCFVFE